MFVILNPAVKPNQCVIELIFHLEKKNQIYLRPITVIIEIVGAFISPRSDWFV